MSYPAAAPGLGAGPSLHLVDKPSGPLPIQTPYGCVPRCPSSVYDHRSVAEYFESTYPRDAAMDRGQLYGVQELLPPTSCRGPSDALQSGGNRQPPSDQCMKVTGFQGLPVRGADSAVGHAAGVVPLAERREFNVIVSNVSSTSMKQLLAH